MDLMLIFLLMAASEASNPLQSMPPVVLWGVQLESSRSIFQVVTTKEFAAMLRPVLKRHMIIAYVESELSTKDLGCSKPECYKFLRQVKPSNYYSKVIQPVQALQQLFAERHRRMTWTYGSQMRKLTCQPNQLIVHKFRGHNLIEHDKTMAAMNERLVNCSLVQIYTAHVETFEEQERRLWRKKSITKWTRPTSHMEMRRIQPRTSPKATNTSQSNCFVLRNKLVVFGVRKIHYHTEARKGIDTPSKHEELKILSEAIDVHLRDEKSIMKGLMIDIVTHMGLLNIRVSTVAGNWRILDFKFQNINYVPRDLLFYSKEQTFCCKVVNIFSAKGKRISFERFNLDIIVKDNSSGMDPNYVPKPCWLCQSLISPGLLQCIFAVTLLLLMLGVGTSMFINIGRNRLTYNISDPYLIMKKHATR